jgi:hypothetical protein
MHNFKKIKSGGLKKTKSVRRTRGDDAAEGFVGHFRVRSVVPSGHPV